MDGGFVFALLIGVAVWILMRRRGSGGGSGYLSRLVMGGKRRDAPSPAAPEEPPAGQPSMPRLGEPGTITLKQIERLRENGFQPVPAWSREEADLVLDAVDYLRAVCAEAVSAEHQPPVDVQNHLLVFILTDEDLRNYVRRWGERRREAGIEGEAAEVKRNGQFDRLAERALALANG